MNNPDRNNPERKHAKTQIILHFQVHQPRRLRNFQVTGDHNARHYFDDHANETIMKRMSQDLYLPANRMLCDVIDHHPDVRLCFSISGETVDQMAQYAPDALESFQALAAGRSIEFFAETYYHSIASLLPSEEFQTQVVRHTECMQRYFGAKPSVFCNTDLIYNDAIGSRIASLGFGGAICRAPAKSSSYKGVYKHPHNDLKLFAVHRVLSEDIALRFGAGKSTLTTNRFLSSLDKAARHSDLILISLDYEALAEHRNAGILEFLRDLLIRLSDDHMFIVPMTSGSLAHTPSGTLTVDASHSALQVSHPWLENDMQREAFELVRSNIEQLNHLSNDSLADTFRSLQAVDHFFCMSTARTGGRHHRIIDQYPSPYEAFINYMNVLNDVVGKLQQAPVVDDPDDHARALEYERQHPKAPVWAVNKESQYKQATESHA